MIERVKLGCPLYCPSFVCVDRYPEDPRVTHSDMILWLYDIREESISYIELKNVLEHIPNVGSLLTEIFRVLRWGGMVKIIADNASYPFYYIHIPKALWSKTKYGWFGFGVHNGSYPSREDDKHFHIFTKDHLENLLQHFGFTISRSRYGLFKYGLIGLDSPLSPFIYILAVKAHSYIQQLQKGDR